MVRGDAGMGKSRLVREFRHELVQAGVKVLECRCRADASASPYLTLAEALRRWLDIGPDDAAARLCRSWPPLPETSREGEPLGLLAALLGLAPQPPQSREREFAPPPALPAGGVVQAFAATAPAA